MMEEDLLRAAKEARKKAYCPYSHFSVGAALLADDGRIFTGCNLENASFGATICAERAAIASAVSAGARHFAALAIVGGRESEAPSAFCPPCGVCRQVLAEFCDATLPVCLTDGKETKTYRLGELIPLAFSIDQLGKRKNL